MARCVQVHGSSLTDTPYISLASGLESQDERVRKETSEKSKKHERRVSSGSLSAELSAASGTKGMGMQSVPFQILTAHYSADSTPRQSCQRSILTFKVSISRGQTPAKEPQKPHPASPLPRFVVFCHPDMSRPWLNGMADLKCIRRRDICFSNI